MNRLSKEDLGQMNQEYFQSLDKEKLVEVAGNLHQLAVEQLERLEQNSENSSRPPSTDNIYNALVAEEKVEQEQEQALETEIEANEILRDWDAVVAFVTNPQLPPTNNEAERALRHAVITRQISYGTRSTEGSLAYCSLLSVIETCRLRKVNPWSFIAQVVTLARKGFLHPPLLAVS